MELSKKQIDKAGESLRLIPHDSSALDILSKWRSNHVYPLSLAFNLLKRHADKIGSSAIYGQRLKRVSSVLNKLNRLASTKLSRMQDIGGCRVVLNDFNRLTKLYDSLKKTKVVIAKKDYIFYPKSDGYRGIHLVYQCSSKDLRYNDLKIELQLRTKLQHAWATTVEIIDSFEGVGLKAGGGSAEWKEFFYLLADEFAKLEQLPLHNNTLENRVQKIIELAKKLEVLSKLQKYTTTVSELSRDNIPTRIKNADFCLLKLNVKEQSLHITPYDDQFAAEDEYIQLEKIYMADETINILLVKMSSVKQLRKSYPNYFADTRLFCDKLVQILN